MSRGSGRALALEVWALGLAIVHVALLRRWLPELASDHGRGVDRMIHYTMLTAAAMLLLGHGVLGALLWRSGGRAEPVARVLSHRSERRWSVAAAVVVALIAEGGVLALGFPVWNQYFGTTAPANALVIEVTAEQFGWNVRYAGADNIFGRTEPRLITLDVMHAVVGRAVKIRLRSKDVLHGFFLPNLRVKQDAVPGMTIELWFTPSRTG